jgi:hypothetical protein
MPGQVWRQSGHPDREPRDGSRVISRFLCERFTVSRPGCPLAARGEERNARAHGALKRSNNDKKKTAVKAVLALQRFVRSLGRLDMFGVRRRLEVAVR